MIRNIKIIAIQMKNINVQIKENPFKKKKKNLDSTSCTTIRFFEYR